MALGSRTSGQDKSCPWGGSCEIRPSKPAGHSCKPPPPRTACALTPPLNINVSACTGSLWDLLPKLLIVLTFKRNTWWFYCHTRVSCCFIKLRARFFKRLAVGVWKTLPKICHFKKSSLFGIVVVSLLAHTQDCKSLFLPFFSFDEGHSQVPLWDTVGHDLSSRNAVTQESFRTVPSVEVSQQETHLQCTVCPSFTHGYVALMS